MCKRSQTQKWKSRDWNSKDPILRLLFLPTKLHRLDSQAYIEISVNFVININTNYKSIFNLTAQL